MKLFDLYLTFIILVKIGYIITILLENADLDKKMKKKVNYYHNKLHVLFYLLMGILLVIMFNPFVKEVKVSGHEKLFIFILGVLMVIDILKRYFAKNSKIGTGIQIANEIIEIL